MIAGANAVQVGTAELRRSVHLDRSCSTACTATCERHGIARLADITGSLDTTQKETGVDQLLIALDVDERASGRSRWPTRCAASPAGSRSAAACSPREGPGDRPSAGRAAAIASSSTSSSTTSRTPSRTRGRSRDRAGRVDGQRARRRADCAMMQAARDAAHDDAPRGWARTPPLVIAVTVLTSMNERRRWRETGVERPGAGSGPAARASWRRRRASTAWSRRRRRRRSIRQRCGPEFAIVTPGIRGGGARTAGKDDQERTMGPARGDRGGRELSGGRAADHRRAPTRVAAAEEIVDEMRSRDRTDVPGRSRLTPTFARGRPS